MLIPIDQIKRRARWHTRDIALAVIGGALLLVGLGFFLAAAWTLIAEHYSGLIASASIGGVFFGVGLIVLALRRREPAPVLPTLDEHLRAEAARRGVPPPGGQLPMLVEAFVFGVHTYLQIRKRRR
ncbi:hypothetical protein [Pararhodobacter sp. SW119]|uniref:hypothetical protein n=1 Tax=Pararhodobacter sp. SW119 TaxID=2780075 RepID=UPI001AE0AF79|nr:hypothetical protein [Pararhodobacter sp. SW119]